LKTLRDAQSTRCILTQIDRLAFGNAGHARGVGEGVKELKTDYGPGYRVYSKKLGTLLVVLLCGGDKSWQELDIAKAKILAANLALEDEDDEGEDLSL
jgi:putative addiction module killer protein